MNELTFLGIDLRNWEAAFTLGILFVVSVHARIYWIMLRSTKTVERAYLDMSHQPPGLRNVGPDVSPTIRISIVNHGKTPGDIDAVAFDTLVSNRLPNRFPDTFRHSKRQRFVLNPTERINWWPDDPLPALPANTYKAIMAGELTMWVIGYVDYRDRWHRRFRSRYTRRYDPEADPGPNDNPVSDRNPATRNNLLIEMTPGYNIDYEITENGEPKNPEEYL